MSSIHGRTPTYVIHSWQEAEEVRRVVRERGWAAAARRLGWPESNARQNIAGALRRAPAPPPPPPPSPEEEEERERAVREAEEDPVLSRRCAKCGRPNFNLVHIGTGDGRIVPTPVGFVRLGGRWLCPDCAPKRRARPPEICAAFAAEHRAVFR